jgi:hypothetical protein
MFFSIIRFIFDALKTKNYEILVDLSLTDGIIALFM